VLPDPRAERRRRLAEPDLEFRALCARKGLPASSTLQLERAWDAWQAKRYQRGETGQQPGYTDNPFRPRWPFARTPAPLQETGRRRVCSRLDCLPAPLCCARRLRGHASGSDDAVLTGTLYGLGLLQLRQAANPDLSDPEMGQVSSRGRYEMATRALAGVASVSGSPELFVRAFLAISACLVSMPFR
jgi:hypothetical protein